MFKKVFLNRRRVVLIAACLIVWQASLVLYLKMQQPIEEDHLIGSTWCHIQVFPPTFSRLRFNDDGTFERQITKPDGICATLSNDAGSWSVYEEGSKTWIRVVGGEDMLVKAYIGNYLRLEGDFAGWGNSVNLYRCNETLYPAN